VYVTETIPLVVFSFFHSRLSLTLIKVPVSPTLPPPSLHHSFFPPFCSPSLFPPPSLPLSLFPSSVRSCPSPSHPPWNRKYMISCLISLFEMCNALHIYVLQVEYLAGEWSVACNYFRLCTHNALPSLISQLCCSSDPKHWQMSVFGILVLLIRIFYNFPGPPRDIHATAATSLSAAAVPLRPGARER